MIEVMLRMDFENVLKLMCECVEVVEREVGVLMVKC